jgi:hypothetical protein
VFSPGNVKAEIVAKTRAYFAAGAQEVWHVARDGRVRFFDQNGELPQSRFTVTITLPDPAKGYP